MEIKLIENLLCKTNTLFHLKLYEMSNYHARNKKDLRYFPSSNIILNKHPYEPLDHN